MLSILGPGARLCDGITRREALRVGGSGFTGSCGPTSSRSSRGRIGSFGFVRDQACILIFNYGGPSHLDIWDLKPDAPAEIRGEFKPPRPAYRESRSRNTCLDSPSSRSITPSSDPSRTTTTIMPSRVSRANRLFASEERYPRHQAAHDAARHAVARLRGRETATGGATNVSLRRAGDLRHSATTTALARRPVASGRPTRPHDPVRSQDKRRTRPPSGDGGNGERERANSTAGGDCSIR